MIIDKIKTIPYLDAKEHAWRGIAQYQNIDLTTARIKSLHNLNNKQAANAKKQAIQIKYCLTQAKEYHTAATKVSLATKPVLLYYCIMSLALAEILIKQDANSRLQALRANHNCHGLSIALSGEPLVNDDLVTSAGKMYAKPQIGSDGKPKGTFEVWLRTAREYPAPGYIDLQQAGGTTKSFGTILAPENFPPQSLTSNGVSLLEAITNLPYLGDTLSRWGCLLKMVRAHLKKEIFTTTKTAKITLVVHPTNAFVLNEFNDACKFQAEFVNSFQIVEMPSGYILTWDPTLGADIYFPYSTCTSTSDIFFACNKRSLGEFGYLYIALHIMGNFARYYPDIWMHHIETNSPLANTIDDLCENALTRLPILAISELTRIYHVIDK